MGDKKRSIVGMAILAVICITALHFPRDVWGAESPSAVIAEAKAAIEQARQAGAEKKASAELSQAKAWLAQAEKEYDESQSLLSRTMKLVISNEERAHEIIYLATMAKAKALTAEARAKRVTTIDELKEVQKDLGDYQTSLTVLKKNQGEAERAKGVQAKAEAELIVLGEAKRKTAELEELKKKELAEARSKNVELDALKQKELQQSRALEAQRVAEKEKEQGKARLETERMAFKKEQDEAQAKARDAQAVIEREKMATMQQKMAAMEKEKAMLADAAKVPQSTARMSNGEIIITLLAVNLFSPKNELHDQGKTLLDGVGTYLKKYPASKTVIRGYTDSVGKTAANQTLSERRAQKVKEYLAVYQNLPAAGITTEGFGPAQPTASNATEAGRALNRRVEIAIPIGQ